MEIDEAASRGNGEGVTGVVVWIAFVHLEPAHLAGVHAAALSILRSRVHHSYAAANDEKIFWAEPDLLRLARLDDLREAGG